GIRKSFHQVSANFPSVERLIGIEMAARDGMRDQGPRGHAVLEKVALLKRLAGRLIEHVAAATAQEEKNDQCPMPNDQWMTNAQCRMPKRSGNYYDVMRIAGAGISPRAIGH